jgi:ABC-type nitrate/sulfonate/bicarbonate transport system substrate-binding protein
MLRLLSILTLVLCLDPPHAFAAEALKKVRIASKGGGETLLPYLISQRLGFYKDEGFDVETIVTRGTVTTQVVVSGAVDYSNGGSIPAILGGARLKILLISTDKPAQYLVSSAKISQLKQLAGKTIAVSDASGNSTLILRELLAKNGIATESVQMRALGEQSLRLGALLGGAVDATLVSYGAAQHAQMKGFRILAYSGDYVSSLAANLEATDDKIHNAPDEVYRIVKATLKGQLFFHRNGREAAKFIMEVLRLSNAKEAEEFWTERTKQASELAKIGRASDEALATNIDRVANQMKIVGASNRSKEKLGIDQVYDFSFVKKAYEEIRAAKWDPMRYEYVKR